MSLGPDSDADGIEDVSDNCLGTEPGDVVGLEGEIAGCSVGQLVPCEGTWRNHGEFVSATARTTEQFVALGLITEAEKDVIVSEAAQSSCGDKK